MISEGELDRLLQDWAQRNALPPARADAIRATARQTAPELPVRWWKDLFRSMSRPLRAATDPRTFLPASSGGVGKLLEKIA